MSDDHLVDFRPVDDRDLEAISALAHATYGYEINASTWLGSGWVLVDGRTTHAAVRLIDCPQYYGGRPVSASAPVDGMVDASERRQGVGRRLLLETHRELTRRQIAIACGYPVVPGYNRSVGWETTGFRVRYRCRASELSVIRAQHDLSADVTLARWDLSAHPAVAECYTAIASETNGHFARSETWWSEQVLGPALLAGYQGHLVLGDGAPIGYAIHRLIATERGTREMPISDIDCTELVATTPDALVAVFGLLERAGAPSSNVHWWGGSVDPTHVFLGQRGAARSRPVMFISRVLDPQRALEQRGYPHALTAAAELAISDAHRPGRRPYALRVAISNARAEVTPIGTLRPDAAETDIGTFAAIYCGWLTPQMAARLGRLRAPRETLERLALILPAGPSWTREHV